MVTTFFFFNDTATTEIYTLSLHDALPIFAHGRSPRPANQPEEVMSMGFLYRPKLRGGGHSRIDRKSTRLNSSHLVISYAVFCLKKKKSQADPTPCSICRSTVRH